MVVYFKDWNCSMPNNGKASIPAAIFNVWEHHLYHQLFMRLSDDEMLNFHAAYNQFFDNFMFKKIVDMDNGDNDLSNNEFCETPDNHNVK